MIVVDPVPYPSPQPLPLPIELPQDEGVIETELPVIYEGQGVRLPVAGLADAGRVAIKLGPIVAQAKVLDWGSESVDFEAPTVGLAEVAAATLVLANTDGSVLTEIPINFAPAQAVAPQLPQVPVGSKLTLSGQDFGEVAGSVQVHVGQIQLNATVVNWSETTAVVQMPELQLATSTVAELIVASQDGRELERTTIELVAAQ